MEMIFELIGTAVALVGGFFGLLHGSIWVYDRSPGWLRSVVVNGLCLVVAVGVVTSLVLNGS